MAKHLIGFGLFLAIVTFFGLAYWVLSIPPIPSVDRVIPFEVSSYPTDCYLDAPTQIGTTRAVADRSRGEVTIYFSPASDTADISPAELNVGFAFYAVRGDQTRVMDANDSMVTRVNRDDGTKWILRYKAAWIKQMSWNDNLYIVPNSWDGSAKFSKKNAVPVLIQN